MHRVISDSRFSMWRAVVALTHADKVVMPEEKEFIRRFYNTVPFTNEQKHQLEAELRDPQDIAEIFPRITDARDRAELIYFARMMFWSDGDYARQEAEILQRLKGEVIENLNLDELMQETDRFLNERPQRPPVETPDGLVDEKLTARNTVGLKAIIYNMYHRLNPDLGEEDPGLRLLKNPETLT